MGQSLIPPWPWVAGQLLIQAKEALDHGQFMAMTANQLPFTHNTACRLMSIAHNPVLSNFARVQNLPPSWTTLYDLSRLPMPILEQAIVDGRVHPGMFSAL